jgi:Ca2+-binding RTX toxin-like protein
VAAFTGLGNDVFDNSFGGVVAGSIRMEAGDDVVIAGKGAETIDGGSGWFDTISYINHPRSVLINLSGQVTADGVASDTLTSFENAIGSAYNDTIYGDDTATGNVLDGGPGGSDGIFGGGGPDTVSYSSAVRAVLINLTAQRPQRHLRVPARPGERRHRRRLRR